MPNASGQITNHDVRRMRELHSQGMSQRRIAEALGINRTTVEYYTNRHEMYGRAHRYAVFVESASRHGVPLLVSPTPF